MTACAEQLLARVGFKSASEVKTATTAPTVPAASARAVIPNIAEKPAKKYSITEASRETGVSRDTLYRLYRAGFIKGWMPGPKLILLDAADLREFLTVSAQPGFWTPIRKQRYNCQGGDREA